MKVKGINEYNSPAINVGTPIPGIGIVMKLG
jgi:hypothetical protein